jgi:hypothetical protein
MELGLPTSIPARNQFELSTIDGWTQMSKSKGAPDPIQGMDGEMKERKRAGKEKA